MEKMTVMICEQEILEYNLDLFTGEQIGEILVRSMAEIGAMSTSRSSIVLCNFDQLSKLNDLMVSYLSK